MRITVKRKPLLLESPEVLRSAVSLAVKRAAQKYVEMIHETIDRGEAFTPRTGNLQRSIGWYPKDDFSAVVFANAEYAPFVEFGTGPHLIEPRNRKALMFPVGKRYVFAKRVRHPGSRPYPFFYRDFEERKTGVLKEFTEALLEKLHG